MKKFLALLLAVLMVVGMFAACGNKPADNDDANATITDPEKVAD